MNASELVAERAQHIARIEEIDKALELLESPAKPVEIGTRRNLRNTWLPEGIQVYTDENLTAQAHQRDHGGWITAQDAARLNVEAPDEINDGYICVYE